MKTFIYFYIIFISLQGNSYREPTSYPTMAAVYLFLLVLNSLLNLDSTPFSVTRHDFNCSEATEAVAHPADRLSTPG